MAETIEEIVEKLTGIVEPSARRPVNRKKRLVIERVDEEEVGENCKFQNYHLRFGSGGHTVNVD